ncbi:hypothetical protein FOMPIDRAFT_1055060 [Fomitopsis schrenkii]|uniref:Uncharacterized protein n=1 Tax=Fomitopsis schrenkii TaxID=2126942 RepID=S8EXY6_FOMSC|nr:hypothetical protein FOMPIDRAFT_1055060 [Fomitopsis schrenkii]
MAAYLSPMKSPLATAAAKTMPPKIRTGGDVPLVFRAHHRNGAQLHTARHRLRTARWPLQLRARRCREGQEEQAALEAVVILIPGLNRYAQSWRSSAPGSSSPAPA